MLFDQRGARERLISRFRGHDRFGFQFVHAVNFGAAGATSTVRRGVEISGVPEIVGCA